MPQRFRSLVPLPKRLLLVRVVAVAMGLLGLANAFVGKRPSSMLEAVFFFALCLILFRQSLRGLASNDSALSIVTGWSGRVIRYDVIESFQWLHNLENFGVPGKRLWVVLDDGQRCPTPVVTGQTSLLSHFVYDIWLTPDKAAALIADLESRHRRQQVRAV